jgi:VCBS repeat-containing protein
MSDNGKNGRVTKQFNGVKIFSATMAHDREMLGDKVTAWIRSNPGKEVVDTVVTQSSDEAFHCIAITIFFWHGADDAAAAR